MATTRIEPETAAGALSGDPTFDRLEDQIDWYDRRSRSNQRLFKLVKGVQLVAAATIPVVATLDADSKKKVIPELDQRNVSEIASAMLEKVPLTLRDNVRLFAYALDHKPRGGPRAVSPLRSIDIREFKKRWRFEECGGGGGGGIPPDRQKVSDGLMQLGQIITAQRVVVSDTFLLRESTRSAAAAVTASAKAAFSDRKP